MGPDPLVVFFDTFTHNGQIQENVDCVRFKSAVKLVKICILPFGSVVESNLSDEPLLGATNPAKFDIKVYSNSQSNCIVLQNVASSKFNERRGINTIFLEKHVQSNFLLFRGRYSTLTVALFGLPTLSMSLPPVAPPQHLSIPLSTVNLIKPIATTITASTNNYFSTVDSLSISMEHTPMPPATWSQCGTFISNPVNSYVPSTTVNTQPLQSENSLNTVQNNVEPNYETKTDENTVVTTSEASGAFEDGEIQDVDYDEVSSNEELFSEIEEDGEQQQLDGGDIAEIESQLGTFQWKFNLHDFVERYTHGPLHEHQRIADPSLTLFQLHCWLLERTSRKESQLLLENQDNLPQYLDEVNEMQTESNITPLLLPRDDWVDANQSADYLVNLIQKFGSIDQYNEEWIEALENIGVHLAPGLASLHLTDQKLFQDVIQTLILWVFNGLDINVALRQTDSSYIVRHLIAGVNMAGTITGTINSDVASALLYPADKSEGTQVQHLLLNLLESPLITTPLRMGICRALDQTMRMPIGLDSFLGINGSDQKLSDDVHKSKTQTKRMKLEQLEMLDMENKSSLKLLSEKSSDYTQDHELFDNQDLGNTVHTPYQRFLCIVAASKNSRVTAAYQKLLNKVHFYELLLDYNNLFAKFVDKLNGKSELGNLKSADQSEQSLLQNWLNLLHNQQTLLSYLKEIIIVIQNAEEIIANPRNSLPCPLLLNDSKRNFHSPYPDLYSIIDSCGLLESIAALIEYLQMDNCNYFLTSQIQFMKLRDFMPTMELSQVLHKLISVLCTHSYGLQLFAARPDTTLRIIKACLNKPFEEDEEEDGLNECEDLQSESRISNLFLIGLELSFKLETLHYVDVFISWTRRKGVTGVYSFVAQLHSDVLHTDEHRPLDLVDTGDSILRDALLGLCRLCLHTVSGSSQTTNLAGFASTSKLSAFTNPEILQLILCSSAPVWIAEVLVMDDYFSTLLMLLEAFYENELEGGTNITVNNTQATKMGSNLIKVMSSDKLIDDSKTTDAPSPNPEQSSLIPADVSGAVSSKTLIHNQLCGPLQLSSLLNTLVLIVFRHSENITYLDHFGPRLVQLLPATVVPDNMDDLSPPMEMFSRLNSFGRLLGNYLHCLRRDSSYKSNISNMLNMPLTSPLAPGAATNLINQLKQLTVDLTDALDNLSSLELTDELLSCQTGSVTSHSNRRALSGTQIVAGHLIPASLLTLLRLLRTHILGANSNDLVDTDNLFLIADHPEKQIILSRSQVLIELYAANGLNLLTTIIEKLSNFFILKCEAIFQQSNQVIDLIDISSCNANMSIVFGLFDSASQLISALLQTIVNVHGSKYCDTNLWKSLFQAYTCTVYAYCPPGPKLTQLKRIRSNIISSLTVYGLRSGLSGTLNMDDVKKSAWVSMLRELIHFTISSPCFYIPGLKMLLDLLPLSLPIVTVEPLNSDVKEQLLQNRDFWAFHLVSLSTELTGLIELLGSTLPSPNNPLYCCLSMFVKRLVDLGSPFAPILVNACLDSLIEVCSQLSKQLDKQEKLTTDGTSNREMDNLPSSTNHLDANTNVLTKTSQTYSDTYMPSAKILLLFQSANYGSLTTDGVFNSETALINESNMMLNTTSTTNTNTTTINNNGSNNNNNNNSNANKDPDSSVIKTGFLSKLPDSSELTSVLSFMQLMLSIPQCKYAVLDALRQIRRDEHSSNAEEDPTLGQETVALVNNRRLSFQNIVNCLLCDYSDKTTHINTQLKVLHCIRLLVDPNSLTTCPNLPPSSSTSPICMNPIIYQSGYQDEYQFLADNLPDTNLLKDIVVILVKHINHPDRDLLTLPNALEPLIILTEHDVGFWIVKEVLDSPVAFSNGQHLFANLVQRVNDCFSVDSPDCQATLTGCLRLIQSLLVTDPNESSLTFFTRKFASSNQIDSCFTALTDVGCEFNKPGGKFKRTAHISGDRVRELLGWSGSRDEGKPVRDLHALLEMLADDEPSLEYLRSGMKNLLALLSNEFDMSDYKEFTDFKSQTNFDLNQTDNLAANDKDIEMINQSGSSSSLPQPRSVDTILGQFEKFLSLRKINNLNNEHDIKLFIKQFSFAEKHLIKGSSFEPSFVKPVAPSQLGLVHCDLADLAAKYCNGLRIRDHLAKCGRPQNSAEVAIRHQKRRRGQASIIQTGTSSKKFVAPMRGRGFMLRNTATANSSSTNTTGSGLVSQMNTGVSGTRLDPFRSRPLNTSRPPSLHVDDFTKLEKEEQSIEEMSRTARPYRDNRSVRGRGLRYGIGRGSLSVSHNPTNLSTLPALSFGIKSNLNQMHTNSLLPNWPINAMPISLLPFAVDSRSNSEQCRDRHAR